MEFSKLLGRGREKDGHDLEMEQMLAVIPCFFAGEGDWRNSYSKAAIFKFKWEKILRTWNNTGWEWAVVLQSNSAIFLARQILYDNPAQK